MEKTKHSSAKPRTPLNRRLSLWVAVLIILTTWTSVKFFNNYISKHHAAAPILVVTAKATTKDIPVYLNALGTVTPTYNVTVRTQINGTLLEVFYKEGQLVKAGDILAQIDSRPYEAQLVEYEGQLARDQALLDNAQTDLKRYQTLWKQDSISQQTLATQDSLVRQYNGAVQIDNGLIAVTKVNLIYCKIVAPIDGRIGLRLVDPGNVVKTTDTNGIAIINTLNPITVIFTLPEDNIPELISHVYADQPYQVDAYDRQQTTLLATGKLLTIDNQIDPNTGTVKFKAVFDNADNALFPDQFVNIRLRLKILHNAIVVPTAAIQFNTNNNSVFVVDRNGVVSSKPVITGPTQGDITSITSGLLPNDIVVTEGADNLINGSKVLVDNSTPSSIQHLTYHITHSLNRHYLA